jgi:lambda family phage portal protein
MGYLRTLGHAFTGLMRASVGFSTTGTPAAYDAAGSGARSSSWNPGTEAISALLTAHGDTLRKKVRQLVRNNAWASNALDSYVANAIGTGIVPTSLHPDPATKQAIEQAWLRWTDESDADGVCDFYGQQQLAARMMLEGGECFARLRPRRPEDGLSVPLQIQLLEAEQLPLTKIDGGQGNNKVRAGIEFDLIGRRVAYHFYEEHPYSGSTALDPVAASQTKRVPSVLVSPTAGALHLFTPIRGGQLRGQPKFTPVLTKLYELDQFDDATLSKQKNLAFFMLAIKRLSQEGTGIMREAASGTGGNAETDDPHADAEVIMEPNTMQYLADDEEIQEIGGKGPGSEYETFMSVQLHAIAAGLGITYEQLTGDLKGVTYSSIRQGVLEFRRKCEQWQHNVMVFQFCRPIWRAWMDWAVLSGALVLPGYAEDPWPYLQVEWTPPAWPWVDPKADVEAAVLEVRNGFNSRTDICKQKGTDRQTVDKKQAEDNASADQAGLKYDSDGRQPASGAAAAGAPSRQQQEERGQQPASEEATQ